MVHRCDPQDLPEEQGQNVWLGGSSMDHWMGLTIMAGGWVLEDKTLDQDDAVEREHLPCSYCGWVCK